MRCKRGRIVQLLTWLGCGALVFYSLVIHVPRLQLAPSTATDDKMLTNTENRLIILPSVNHVERKVDMRTQNNAPPIKNVISFKTQNKIELSLDGRFGDQENKNELSGKNLIGDFKGNGRKSGSRSFDNKLPKRDDENFGVAGHRSYLLKEEKLVRNQEPTTLELIERASFTAGLTQSLNPDEEDGDTSPEISKSLNSKHYKNFNGIAARAESSFTSDEAPNTTNVTDVYARAVEHLRVKEGNLWLSWPECLCGESSPSGLECSPQMEPPGARTLAYGSGGTCSWRAARYSSDRVISVTTFGPSASYEAPLASLIWDSPRLFPGWSVWVYVRHPHPQQVCTLLRSAQHVFFCDSRSLPALGDLKRTNPRMWKVAPLGDPNLRAVYVRSVGSLSSPREAQAVQQWLHSGKTWHVMRDHTQHTMPVVDGLWCARWTPTSAYRMAALRNILLQRSYASLDAQQTSKYLSDVLWPQIKLSGSVLQHDAYRCAEALPESFKPWPSRREGNYHVGMREKLAVSLECPAACRPIDHQDWTTC
ncbi:uncharacterized protein LOC108665936 [Hyalella azteca]|uniref:Uncharacterized protein LOC108665936 n=1 Tax=Hyalella azteca TaxID=294128 RepID=A0A8B7N4E0_HYAAZ|nr:uncharacterized protein LOC108665936 [Hyalella azteca]